MKFYLAAKSQDTSAFRILKEALEEKGHKCSIDWSKHLDCKPFSEHTEICNKQAIEDIKAIDDSDVFIMLYNDNRGVGMFYELGYATARLGQGKLKKIFVLGHDVKNTSMFIHGDGITYVNDTRELLVQLDLLKVDTEFNSDNNIKIELEPCQIESDRHVQIATDPEFKDIVYDSHNVLSS